MTRKKDKDLSFEQLLVSEYFKHGSINKVFQVHKYNLPISFAGYDRVLSKHKVIKSAGPNSKISESLYLLSLLANYKIPLEKAYHLYAPKTMQVSTNTLHRILHYTRLGLTRRQGVALLISPSNDPSKILIGNDNSLTNPELGKKGDFSLPMGHSKLGEPIKDSITRILQNEVFTNDVIEGIFSDSIIPKHIKPVMYINIADICVSVYKLEIEPKKCKFSSFKLSNLKFFDINDLPKVGLRPGIAEIAKNFTTQSYSKNDGFINTYQSDLNSKIYALARQSAE